VLNSFKINNTVLYKYMERWLLSYGPLSNGYRTICWLHARLSFYSFVKRNKITTTLYKTKPILLQSSQILCINDAVQSCSRFSTRCQCHLILWKERGLVQSGPYEFSPPSLLLAPVAEYCILGFWWEAILQEIYKPINENRNIQKDKGDANSLKTA
jgi:hypothetical protein